MNLSFFIEPVDFSFYTDILADRSLEIREARFYYLVVAAVAVRSVIFNWLNQTKGVTKDDKKA